MGSKGSSSNSSGSNFGFSSGTSTYVPNPEAMAAFQQSLGLAQNAVSRPYEPYAGQMVAGFTPDQMSAQQGVRNLQGMAQPYFNTATNLQQQAIDYSDPRNFNQAALNQYENPYQQSVVNATMANLLQNEQEALQGADKRSAAAGTFGGSGQYLGRAEVARQQALANAQVLAQLNQSNYQQAQNQYNQQQAQAIQTAQSAAYGLGQLGNMSQQAALTGLNALSSSGAQQQALAQQQLTGAYNQWLQERAYPFQMAAFYSDIAAGIGPQMGGTTTYSGINMGQTQNQTRQSGGGGGMGIGALTSLMGMLPFKDGGAVKAENEEGFGALRDHKASGGSSTTQSQQSSASPSTDDTATLAQFNERLLNSIGPQNLEQQARQRWVSQAPAQTTQQSGFVIPQALMRTAADGGLIEAEQSDPDYQLSDDLGQHKQKLVRERWVAKHIDPKSVQTSEVGFVIPENLMPRMNKFAGGPIGLDPIDAYKFQPQAGKFQETLRRDRAWDKAHNTDNPHSDHESNLRVHKDAGGGLMDMINKNSLLQGSPTAGNFGDIAKIRPVNNAINNAPAEAKKDFHFLNPAQSKAKTITQSEVMKGVNQAQQAAESAGKGGGGGGGSGGGGAPKMPSMKGKKASGPTADALGENGSTDTPDNQTDQSQENTSNPSQDSIPNEYLAAPEDVPSAPEIDTNNLGDMASPDIAGGGFGGFDMPMMRKGGRVKRAGGGGSSGGSGGFGGLGVLGSLGGSGGDTGGPSEIGPFGIDGPMTSGLTLGEAVLGREGPKPASAAGFGNLKASQNRFTGDNLVNDWMNQYKANYKGGPQLTPEQQGMPSMPDASWYKTPLNVSDLSIGSNGTPNPGGINYTPVMTGMSSGSGMMMAPMFTPPTNGSDYNNTDKMFKAPPTNGKVEGYFTGIGSNQVNPDTGLFNVSYLAPYYGGFYKDGGRVGKADGGSRTGNYYTNLYNALLIAAKNLGAPHPEALARFGVTQSALETQHGQKAPNNNYFGIKDFSGKGAGLRTKEFVNGRMISTSQPFKRYGSMQESANDYIRMMGNNKRYAGVWNADTPQRAIQAQARSGYATDPKYGQLLANVDRRVANSLGQPNSQIASATPTSQPVSFTRAPDDKRWQNNNGLGYKPSVSPNVTTTASSDALKSLPKLTTIEPSTAPRSFFDRLSKEFSGRAEAAEAAPIGSSLNRINPADPSGPLLAPTTNTSSLPARGLGIEAFGTNPPNIDAVPLNRSVDDGSGRIPRIDNGPSPLTGDRPSWQADKPSANTRPAIFDANPAVADAAGHSTLNAEGKVSQNPGLIIDPNANTTFGQFGFEGDVLSPMKMPGAEQPFGFAGVPLTPFSPEPQSEPSTYTSAPTTPAKAAKSVQSAPDQKGSGDWRDQEPWKSDPIGGAFDSLGSNSTPSNNSAGDFGSLFNMDSAAQAGDDTGGFEFPDFEFARGGMVRHGYATDGAVDDNPIAAIGEGLGGLFNANDNSANAPDDGANPISALGEGIANIGSSISQGLGGLFGEEQTRAPRQQVALTENKPSASADLGSLSEANQPNTAQPQNAVAADNQQQRGNGLGILPTHGFLGDGTDYSMSPLRKGLLSAGLAMMASHQSNPLAAFGEGASHGMNVWQNAQEDYDAQQLKQQKLKADQDFARRIAYPASTSRPAEERSPAAPEKTAAPAEKTPSVDNNQSRIDDLMTRRQQVLSIPAATPQQRALQQSTIRNIEWEIGQLQRKKDAGDDGKVGIIGRDEFNRPVYGYTTGAKAGQQLETIKTQGNTTANNEKLSGEDFLATLPDGMAARVKAIAEGREPMPKESNATRATLDAVHRYDPSANSQRYQTRQEFTSEKGGNAGMQITAANTATAHALTALEAADRMKNWNFHLGNKAYHTVAGLVNDPAAVEFNQAVSALNKEVEKYFKGSPPADSAEKRAMENLNTASTPDEYVSALNTIAELMAGKSRDLEYRWKRTMGDMPLDEAAGQDFSFYNPKAKVARDVIEKRYRELHPNEKPFEERYAKEIEAAKKADGRGEVTVAPQLEAIPPAAEREVNKVYTTPKGNFIWNGQGWTPATGAQQ